MPEASSSAPSGLGSPPELPEVTHRWVDAGGLRTHVALAGHEDAPPVLLVHGWPQHWWTWREVIPALAAEHRVIAPDLRGHGWTERPRGGYAKAQLSVDLLALLDALEVERVTWVGHDWGAWIGYLTALRTPDRIERMLAMSVPPPWRELDPRLAAVFLGYQAPLSLPLVGRLVADPMVRRILQVGRSRGQRLSQEDLALFADHVPAPTSVAMYRTFLTRELPPIVAGSMRRQRLEVETEALVGSRDAVCTGLRSGPVAGQPQLTVRVLQGASHWIPEERPDCVLDWVNRSAGS